MLSNDSLLAEAQRQFLICSSCRYCEGYCPTFPAIEGRTTYTAADVAYIANLCHDCRACSQACMYDKPHEFAVNIPRLLGAVRRETYEPTFSGFAQLGVALAALIVLVAAVTFRGGWGVFAIASDAPGSFYAVVPYLWILVPALLLSLWAVVVFARAAHVLARGVAPQIKVTVRDLLGVLHEGLSLVYMRGGGDGCYYPDQSKPSSARRVLHVVLVLGAGLAFAATIAAAIMQDAFDLLPPYPVLSVPVVLGTFGGLCILAGGVGLLTLKRDPAARAGRMTTLDVTFLVALLVVAATGLALLAFRATPSMGALLVVHLAAVATLFITAPYGKFLHVPLRLAALLVFRFEEARMRK